MVGKGLFWAVILAEPIAYLAVVLAIGSFSHTYNFREILYLRHCRQYVLKSCRFSAGVVAEAFMPKNILPGAYFPQPVSKAA